MTSSPALPELSHLPAHRAAIETFVHLARLSMVATDVGSHAYAGLRRDLAQLAAEAGRRRPRREVAVALADLVLVELAPDEDPDGVLRQARDDLVRGRSPHSRS